MKRFPFIASDLLPVTKHLSSVTLMLSSLYSVWPIFVTLWEKHVRHEVLVVTTLEVGIEREKNWQKVCGRREEDQVCRDV